MENEILNQIEQIEQDNPLSGSHEADGRYTWPNRWEDLKRFLLRQEERKTQCA